MIQIIKELNVEVTKPNIFQALVAKQYDMNTRFLKVTLMDCGTRIDVPYIETAKVVINAERKDGLAKGFDGVVNEDGTVTVPLHSWMLELDGTVICDISVIDTAADDNKKLTTTSFTLIVEKATYGGDDVTSDPQYDVLVQLIEDCETALENTEIIAAQKEDIANKITDLTKDFPDDLAYPSANAVKDKLYLKTKEYIGVTDTLLYGSSDKVITLKNGEKHSAIAGDVVLIDRHRLDFNGDGVVDELDTNIMKEVQANLIPYDDRYDLDGDGEITSNDLSTMNKYVAFGLAFEWDGSKWDFCKSYTDITLDKKSLKPQSGVAVGEALKVLVENQVGRKVSDNSEIFNDYENNRALNDYTHAQGKNTVAGVKGFKILEFPEGIPQVGSDTYITVEGNVPELFSYDDVISLQLYSKVGYIKYYFNYGKVKYAQRFDENTDKTVVTVTVLETLEFEYSNEKDDSFVWIPNKPQIGTQTFQEGMSHSEGDRNKANGESSHAEGRENISDGKYSHTEGRNNFAGYACHASGRNTVAIGEQSYTEGNGTKAIGYNCHAQGQETVAKGNSAHASGIKSKALAAAAFAGGNECKAYSYNSHASGLACTVGVEGNPDNVKNGFAHGNNLSVTRYNNQVAFGNSNLEEDEAIFTIGNGYWGNLPQGGTGYIRKNAFVVKTSNPNSQSFWEPKAWAEVDTQGKTDKSVIIKATFDKLLNALENITSLEDIKTLAKSIREEIGGIKK